MVINVAERSLR